MLSQDSSPQTPWVVTMAASAGGLDAIRTVLSALPADLPAAIILVQHRMPNSPQDNFRHILSRVARLPVVSAEDGEAVVAGRIYIARPDLHLTVSPDKQFVYADGRRIKFLLSSANPLLESAAVAFHKRLIAVVLTGAGSDATDGVQTVKAHGGVVIAQDPTTARHSGMPSAAVQSGAVDLILPLAAIGPALDAIIHDRPVAGAIKPA